MTALLALALAQNALEPVRTLRGHEGPVFGVAFHPDGHHLVTAGYDGTVRVWDLAGDASRVLFRGAADMNGVAVSPDGRWVAAASDDATVRVWELAADRLAQTLRDPDARSRAGFLRVAFSPDGSLVAAVGTARTGRVWNVETGVPVGPQLLHEGVASGVAFAGASDRVVTAEWEGRADPMLPRVGKLSMWTVESGELVEQLPLDGDANDVAILPGTDRAAVAGDGGTVWQVDLATHLAERARPHWGSVWCVAAHPVLGTVTGDENGTVALSRGPRADRGHGGAVYGVAIAPDGATIASAGQDGLIRIWRAPR